MPYNNKMPATQLLSFCFTLNNYSPEDVEAVKDFQGKCRYLVIGYEIGQEGTPHLQGYAQLIKRLSFGKLKKLFPKMHIEATRGTPQQAADYCKKEHLFDDFGTLCTGEEGRKKGNDSEKKKYADLIKMAEEGRMQEIKELDPYNYLRMYSTLQKIAKDNPRPIEDLNTTTGMWIYGPSGVGKSRGIREVLKHHGIPFYDKGCNKWWDGYNNEPAVLVDDFDPTHKVLFHYVKRWTDHYAFRAEVKNSALFIRPRLIVFTSQYSIEEVWEDTPTRDAVHRRCKVVYLNDLETAIQWKDEALKEKIEFHNQHNLE